MPLKKKPKHKYTSQQNISVVVVYLSMHVKIKLREISFRQHKGLEMLVLSRNLLKDIFLLTLFGNLT